MLDAGDFLHTGADTLPFGICSDSAAAIEALRDLANQMEAGTVVMIQAQTGCTVAANDMQKHVIFLEYSRRPW
jgi:hypothetical protein